MPNSVPVRVLRTVRVAVAGTVYGREIVAGTDDQVPEHLAPSLIAAGYCEPRPTEPPPPPPIPPVAIPDDWASGNADAVKALAAAITGAEAPRTRAEAEAIVKAEIERRAAAPVA
ncbi:hypothetical protein STAQ_27730 [Allostella sp. ATCC 35155]|nr:hypothetical protein STAQ_27730 [Stella sp. ATCC 35155]